MITKQAGIDHRVDGFLIRFPKVKPGTKPLTVSDNRGLNLEATSNWIRSNASGANVRCRDIKHCFSSVEGTVGSSSHHFLNALMAAYSTRRSVSLRPEVLWQLILSQVVIFIRENEHCGMPNPDEILSIDSDDIKNPLRFLAGNIEFDILDTYVPNFSTMSEGAESAILLTLLGKSSPQCSKQKYSISRGVPEIFLAGTLKDWETLLLSVKNLSAKFEGLKHYFDALLSVLAKIYTCLKFSKGEVDEEFWSSMFRIEYVSKSKVLGGWLAAFIAYTLSPGDKNSCDYVLRTPDQFDWRNKQNDLPLHLLPDSLNFAWAEVYNLNSGEESNFVIVGGVLGADVSKFISPALGFAAVSIN